jgi:hypothetical protein
MDRWMAFSSAADAAPTQSSTTTNAIDLAVNPDLPMNQSP